ncbi:hypothetical protein BpHYR1_035486 [Brachionus plicatilis]|uniref:Uncharacterized protein n=1 Tax=Brachionus plicatilis TaxID=10195 RepID=A0A3M7RQR1_BRAPC|nr:hypothetical protein BpHYR1_035486 [Brachionus plicatilis]
MFNMDETFIYLDCPFRYTFTDKGAKRVKVDTNGAEMVRNSSSITIQKLPKKRGRKPLPRDKNGKIIRQQNL